MENQYSLDLAKCQEDVREFMRAVSDKCGRWCDYGKPVPLHIRVNRFKMIHEEIGETLASMIAEDDVGFADGIIDTVYVALGLAVELDKKISYQNKLETEFFYSHQVHFSLKDIQDSAFDFEVYVLDLVFLCDNSGLPLQPLWDEVHAANMRKFQGGHYDTVTQKWRKPADWVGPDIAGVLAKYPIKR